MLRVPVVITLLILSVSAIEQDVYKSMALRIMRFVSHCSTHISLSLRCFSKEAWEGLEKPLGTFRTESFAECGAKCSGLDGCGMMDYDRHDNRGYKWCTPAKVNHSQLHFILRSQSFYPQIACIQPDYNIRKKKCGYGPVPCPGDVFVYMFTEVPLCESILIIYPFLIFLLYYLFKGPTEAPPAGLSNVLIN